MQCGLSASKLNLALQSSMQVTMGNRCMHKVAAIRKAIDEGIEMLECRHKLIKLAEYEEDDLAKDSDDEKKIVKAEYHSQDGLK